MGGRVRVCGGVMVGGGVLGWGGVKVEVVGEG